MHIITKKRIEEARVSHPECETAMLGWYKIMKNNEFKNYAELKASFNSVDKVGTLYVFDIGGNKLRLIASIHFNRKRLYIRHILTHKDYDKGAWRE